MSVPTKTLGRTRRRAHGHTANPPMDQFDRTEAETFQYPVITYATREYLENRDVDIELSRIVFAHLSALYGFRGSFSDFLFWAVDFLQATDETGLRFQGLRSNQTELLPSASFQAGGGLNIQIQTGCRIADKSPDPILQFDGIHVVSTSNSNMTEDQLETFQREIKARKRVVEFLNRFTDMNLHFVIRSGGEGWDDKICYNIEFSLFPGSLTTYTRAERKDLCRRCGAVLDEPGEVPGLEKPIVGDLCGALLGLWLCENSITPPRDGNVEANTTIKKYISGYDELRLTQRLGPVSWWHVSRSLAHATAATRCAYGLAVGRAVASLNSATYLRFEEIPSKAKAKDYIWYWKGALSLTCEALINAAAIAVVGVMGKRSGFEIEWLAIMVSLVAHLSTWVRLAISRFETLKLRSWKEAKGRVKKSKILEMIVSGEVMAHGSDACWTLADDGFDATGLNPTVKQLCDAGAEICGLTETCCTVIYNKRVAGVLSQESEVRNICYMKRANVALKTAVPPQVDENMVIRNAPR